MRLPSYRSLDYSRALSGMKPLSECRLYTFVDTSYLGDRSVEAVARQLCEGGSDLIQLRAKTSTPDEVRRMAAVLLPIAARASIGLVINDYPQIAADTGAPLCHLGQEDFSNAKYTHICHIAPAKFRLKIGLSTHTPAQAEQALTAGADYIAVGPVYATATKPTAQPVTLEYVRWAARHVSIPWFAIGGITLENVGQVLAAGATRVCVVSAILKAPDIAEACRLFKKRLTSNQI